MGKTKLGISFEERRVSEPMWLNGRGIQHFNEEKDGILRGGALREASDDGVPAEQVWVVNVRED